MNFELVVMATLIVTDGPAKDQRFALADHRLVMVGRDAGCSFQIVDPELSRYHLQIRHAADKKQHFAIDFQSKNGVYVNGRKIESETPLADRDVITIGATRILYTLDDSLDTRQAHEAWKKIGEGHLKTMTLDMPRGSSN